MPEPSGTLIFFTDCFPFGTSETFIENEFPFLLKSFKRIIIVTHNLTDAKTRSIPDSVEIIRIPYKPAAQYKLRAIMGYFNPVVQQELTIIKNEFGIHANKSIVSILLASYAKGLEVNDLLTDVVAQKNIDKNSLYLYAYWMNDITTGVALYRSKNPNVKAFCRVHRWDVYFETQTPPYLPLRNFMIANLDRVYCISMDAIQYLKKLTNGRDKNNLTLSRLGTFNNDKIVAVPNHGMLRIISCSNMIPLKRVNLIIEALALINDIKIEWRHFGKGPMAGELNKLANERLLGKPNITFSFAGQVTNTELLQYYKNNKVDLFINVSETEGIPVSIIEASSFGITVIGTRVGGVAEILEEGENGFLLDPACTAQDVANSISKFYALDETKKEKIRKNAIVIWQQKYSAERNYKEFLESVLSLRSGQAV